MQSSYKLNPDQDQDFLRRRSEVIRELFTKNTREDSAEMNDQYNPDDFYSFARALQNGVLHASEDTIGSALANMRIFLGNCSELMDSESTIFPILNILCEIDFIGCSLQILQNVHRPEYIECLLEVFEAIFYFPEIQNHDLYRIENTDLLDEFTKIAIQPQIILDQESNTFQFGLVSLTSIFGNVHNMSSVLYNSISIYSINCIINYISRSNTLIKYTFENVCPRLYENFIEEKSNEQYVRSTDANVIKCILYLFRNVVTYLNSVLTPNDLVQFMNTFLECISINNLPDSDALYGILNCIEQNISVVDLYLNSPLLECLPRFMMNDDSDISLYSMIAISTILCLGSAKSRQELLKYINWDNFYQIGYSRKDPAILYALCVAIRKILNKNPMLISNMIDSKLFYIIVHLAEEGTYEVKMAAFRCIVKRFTLLPMNFLEYMFVTGDFADIMIDFLPELNDKMAIAVIHAFTHVLKVGTSRNIILSLHQKGLYERLMESIEPLQDADDPNLSDQACQFIEDFSITQAEIEDAEEL
ncbi:hypothetical protein TRFO_00940 [Tritrichomonas foetus]|uniref:Uncharacterized protein n=1 Tax=Tritrichomonas foetus TaxID=1144522 RepID=A0A1J4L2B4_9EUKA|nr:hypothetical protein TRFO_00940 [Tritrichomonas foetus]|eukprot:OHT17655.1 hypothetical protein TRFO_00940 [Tritrichomonas foetus]